MNSIIKGTKSLEHVDRYGTKTFKFQGSSGEYKMVIKIINETGEELSVVDGFQFDVDYRMFQKMLEYSLPTTWTANNYYVKERVVQQERPTSRFI